MSRKPIIKSHSETKYSAFTLTCPIFVVNYLRIEKKKPNNIINKCAEQNGKNCIFSLSEFYSIFSLHKNYFVYFICKYLFLDLKQYLSIFF